MSTSRRAVERILAHLEDEVLNVVRPFVGFIGMPVIALFLIQEFRVNGGSGWLLAELIATCATTAGLLFLPRRVHPLVMVTGLTVLAGTAFMHFGPMLGVGLFMAGACIWGTFRYGGWGALGVTGTLVGMVILSSVLSRLGYDTPFGEADHLTRLRIVVATSASLAGISYVFHVVNRASRTALRSQVQARLEAKEAEIAKQAALDVAAASHRMETVGRLASGVAHDFNNSLMVLQVTLDYLGEIDDEAERKEVLEEGLQAVKAATSTAQQLLTLARGEADEAGHCNPVELLKRFSRSIARILPEGLTLQAHARPCPDVALSAQVIEQILLNLVVNARDALAGTGRIVLRCYTHTDGAACIEVSDDGPGIAPALRSKIFEPFFTTKPVGAGTGLGLAMARDVLEAAGGGLALASTPKGACFVLTLPPAQVGETFRTTHRAPPVRFREGPRVLLVEDNARVRAGMARAMRHAGYRVVEASSVTGAVSGLGEERFGMVCTDGVLPDGSASDVLAAVRSHQGPTPALVVTGYAGLAPGGDPGCPVLRKPISSDVLLEQMHRAITNTPQNEGVREPSSTT